MIATFAKQGEKAGYKVVIVSSDKDLMQLITDDINMFDAMKNKHISSAEVEEKFGVTPSQVLDVLSLIGDSSDNIAGVKGIGKKTAAELIQEFGSLDGIYQNIDAIKQKRRKELLQDGKEDAYLSQRLVKLVDDVAIDIELNELQQQAIDNEKLGNFMFKYGFGSLTSRLKNFSAPVETKQELKLKQLLKLILRLSPFC